MFIPIKFRMSAGGLILLTLISANAQNRDHDIERMEYLGTYPKHRNNGWSNALQGVANDKDNWFFTQTGVLWKFPISHDLKDKIGKTVKAGLGIGRVRIPASLSAYDHFGDLDQHSGLLYVPLEGGGNPRIAVFRSSDLAFLDSQVLLRPGGKPMTQSGWCAINPTDGLLYTSNTGIDRNDNPIFKFKVGFDAGKLRLTYAGSLYLKDEDGSGMGLKPYMQGGDFSTDGRYLFLVNGKAHKFDKDDGGVWVFDALTGRKITKSKQKGGFRFEFHPGGTKFEEPEGITYWNLDGRSAPSIKGQLHVILLDNDLNGDEFYLKHYRIHRSGN